MERRRSVALIDDELGQARPMRRRHVQVSPPRSGFAGFQFPLEAILVAVRWYLRYGLSYRDGEELLAERGIDVDHVTVYRWVQRFTPRLIDAAKPGRHTPGDRWFVDETSVTVAGRWVYLYRAIDQVGQVIDILLLQKRDLAVTRRFFTRALGQAPPPAEGTTDRTQAYPRILDELLPAACHTFWGRQRSPGEGCSLWRVTGLARLSFPQSAVSGPPADTDLPVQRRQPSASPKSFALEEGFTPLYRADQAPLPQGSPRVDGPATSPR